MNAEIKKMWVKALRSGRYLNTKDTLHNEMMSGKDSFCCLGVLTNLYVEETGDVSVWEGGPTVLPERVFTWAGLADSNPDVVFKIWNCTLANLNDGHDGVKPALKSQSFSKIADVIEEQL